MSLLTSFRDAPIKRKLVLISLLTSGLALLYIVLILAASSWVDRRADAVSDLTTYARMIGANATSAILFDDADAATKTLAALAAKPDIVDAVIYDKAGKMFARYLAPQPEQGGASKLCAICHESHHQHEAGNPTFGSGTHLFGTHLFDTHHLVLSEPIGFQGKALGSIYLEFDLRGMYASILRDAGLVFLVALSAFLASLFLFAKLQKTIVEPLAELSDGMEKVSAEQDYALRVEVHGKDEVGRLADAFNDMLERIQQRDTELAQHREHLEEEVAQRTASLRESENRFRKLFENANDAIFIHTSTGEILDANPQAENMLGYTLAVLKTMPIPALHPPEELETSKKAFEETISKGSARFESRFRHSGGGLIDVEISARIVDSEKGIIQGVARDITERKRVEEQIRKQQELTTQIIETIPMRVFWKDRDLRYLGCNTQFAKDAGQHRPDELTGKDDFDMGWKDQAEFYRADDRQVMDSNTPKLSYDEPQTTPEGGLIWLRTSKVPLRNEVDEVFGILGVYENITSYKQMELRLLESEERFRKAFQYSAIGMALVGLDGQWLKVNGALCQIVGYPEHELLGRTFQDITHPDDLQADLGFVAQLLSGEIDHYQMEKRYLHKDGHVVWIRLSVSLIRDAQDKPVHFVSQIDDITEDRRAEEQIRQMNEELEAKVQERTRQLLEAQEELVRKEKLAVLGQVAGSVGHELRNPLGVMSNAVYFLQTVLPDADETVKEYLDIIKNEIAGSERIVSDLLDSVRTKPPHPEMVGVAELIGQTLRKLTIPPSVTVKLDIPATLPPLRVDGMQIGQVLRNFISNGVEAMPEGGTLEIRAVENKTEKTIAVSVRDSGIGMTPEQLGKLFQPLFTTKARGIGLGLVVVKNLTEANGGTVQVESEAGKGTVFTVTLPAADETGASI
ncbi:MAG: PAS domain S-box protein [Gallionella sp.]|nr:PAS domain S-box protein [Gallionella sp.]